MVSHYMMLLYIFSLGVVFVGAAAGNLYCLVMRSHTLCFDHKFELMCVTRLFPG